MNWLKVCKACIEDLYHQQKSQNQIILGLNEQEEADELSGSEEEEEEKGD